MDQGLAVAGMTGRMSTQLVTTSVPVGIAQGAGSPAAKVWAADRGCPASVQSNRTSTGSTSPVS